MIASDALRIGSTPDAHKGVVRGEQGAQLRRRPRRTRRPVREVRTRACGETRGSSVEVTWGEDMSLRVQGGIQESVGLSQLASQARYGGTAPSTAIARGNTELGEMKHC